MTTIPINADFCLCGSGLQYSLCCGRYHNGDAIPPTAESLLRSRFTAYAQRNAAYLLASWDKTKRPAEIDFTQETAEWQKLQILSIKKGAAWDSKGLIDFKAFYQQDGEAYFMHEISRFSKIGQHWFYLDGVIKAVGKVSSATNLGKNAACGCGSGKKFKRCCGANV